MGRPARHNQGYGLTHAESLGFAAQYVAPHEVTAATSLEHAVEALQTLRSMHVMSASCCALQPARAASALPFSHWLTHPAERQPAAPC
jgi:hypothetical protein